MTAATRGAGVLWASVAAWCSLGCAQLVGADFDGLKHRDDSLRDAGSSASVLRPSFRIETVEADAQLLGLSVAVEGNTALIGARDPGWIGIVYVVERQANGGWQSVQRLSAGRYATQNGQFGSSIGISGDWALVGARGAGLPASFGSAYLFHRQTDGSWLLTDPPLSPPAQALGDNFGMRVALVNDLAVVGAPGDGSTQAGAAYMYQRDASGAWTFIQALAPPDGHLGDSFGTELALSGNTLAISAPGDDEGGVDAGAAYVFTSIGGGDWRFAQKLLPTGAAAAGARFGDGTLGLGDGTLIVPTLGGAAGALAFALDDSATWVPDTLDPPAGISPIDGFGWRASLHGDVALVAVRQSNEVDFALVYRRRNGLWVFDQRLESGSTSPDYFGWTVAFDGHTALFGATFFRDQEGAAYVFDVPP